MGSGQAVRHLTLDQAIEGSNPSSPAETRFRSFIENAGRAKRLSN